MSAYLFTGWTSQFKAGRLGDSCVSLVIYGADLERARAWFEHCLLTPNQGEEAIPTKVEKIVVAPVLEHLFTEAGPVPMDWPQACEEAGRTVEEGSADAFEQGYWADCDALVSPEHLSPDVPTLLGQLPEDVRSGMNWSPEKQFFFLLSVLSPPPPLPEVTDLEDSDLEEPQPDDAEAEDVASFRLNDRATAFPELAEREAAVVVRARNSVVAAWVWRRHAAITPLARNHIRVDPWCGATQIEDGM